MKFIPGTILVFVIVMLCGAAQAPAQSSGEPARMLPGGEWALGRWEGNIVSIGTAAGTAGLSQSPRTLIVKKSASGEVTCLWFISDDPKSRQWTKRCVISTNGISFETAAASAVELSRSGQNGLTGRFVAAGARAASSGGMSGTQVHLNRVQ